MTLLAQSMAGEALYLNQCASCHGPDAIGIETHETPRLRGQHDWYLVTSMKKFAQGERSHPKMTRLSEQDFKSLAAYLSALK